MNKVGEIALKLKSYIINVAIVSFVMIVFFVEPMYISIWVKLGEATMILDQCIATMKSVF